MSDSESSDNNSGSDTSANSSRASSAQSSKPSSALSTSNSFMGTFLEFIFFNSPIHFLQILFIYFLLDQK